MSTSSIPQSGEGTSIQDHVPIQAATTSHSQEQLTTAEGINDDIMDLFGDLNESSTKAAEFEHTVTIDTERLHEFKEIESKEQQKSEVAAKQEVQEKQKEAVAAKQEVQEKQKEAVAAKQEVQEKQKEAVAAKQEVQEKGNLTAGITKAHVSFELDDKSNVELLNFYKVTVTGKQVKGELANQLSREELQHAAQGEKIGKVHHDEIYVSNKTGLIEGEKVRFRDEHGRERELTVRHLTDEQKTKLFSLVHNFIQLQVQKAASVQKKTVEEVEHKKEDRESHIVDLKPSHKRHKDHKHETSEKKQDDIAEQRRTADKRESEKISEHNIEAGRQRIRTEVKADKTFLKIDAHTKKEEQERMSHLRERNMSIISSAEFTKGMRKGRTH